MKSSLLLFMMASATFLSARAQTDNSIAGTYANIWESNTGEALQYALTLNEDGTFNFQSKLTFANVENEKILSVKGSWKLQNQMLILLTDANDGNSNELTSKINNTKARYVGVSARNPNFNLVKPSLKFYKSDVFYAKDMELLKEDSTVTTRE